MFWVIDFYQYLKNAKTMRRILLLLFKIPSDLIL